jgi:hypothetical protein
MWPHYKAAIEKAFVGVFEPDEIGQLADVLRKAKRVMKSAGT